MKDYMTKRLPYCTSTRNLVRSTTNKFSLAASLRMLK
uniref:Uncharacterized protein n=1 Tax=Arundo donax TaxID=35708 RepID=A0A0A9ESC5_ARUDO